MLGERASRLPVAARRAAAAVVPVLVVTLLGAPGASAEEPRPPVPHADAVVEAGVPVLRSAAPVAASRVVRRIKVDLVLVTAPNGRRDATRMADLEAGVRNVDAFYDRNTGGRIRFSVGRTRTWVRSSTSCSIDVSRSAARRLGWSERGDRVLVAYQPSSCYFAGVAELPGNFVLLARYAGTSAMAHEIGHTLGLSHSNLSRCTLAFSQACSTATDARRSVEYGDATDLMGGGESQGLSDRFAVRPVEGTLNPRQLRLLGVPFASTRISLTRSTPQTIRLQARVDRLGWSAATLVWRRRTYWLTYLSGSGVDDPLAGESYATRPYHGQVVVQTKIGARSLLVTPTRTTSSGPGLPDWALTSLPNGRTLQVRVQGSTAVLTITPPDAARPRSVAVTPGNAALRVSWSRGSTSGVTGYVVEAHGGADVLTRTVPVTTTSVELTGGRAGQPYRVRVYPVRAGVRGTPLQAARSVAPLPPASFVPASARAEASPGGPASWRVVIEPPTAGWGVVRSVRVVVRYLPDPLVFERADEVTSFGAGPVEVPQWWAEPGPFRVTYTVTYTDGGTYTAVVASSYTPPV